MWFNLAAGGGSRKPDGNRNYWHQAGLGGHPATGGLKMAKAPKKLDELFHDTLKDIYYTEKKILSTLPKMAKAAHSPELIDKGRITKLDGKG
jgi:Domain of unknown function (DUF892)